MKLFFQRYPLEMSLDVVSCLECYIERTDEWRVEPDQQQLFLAIVKPHKAVATCTISRWLKTLMAMSGIDTNKFKAHSTRAASTSKAKAQGLSTEQIIKHANWSKSATFCRFYHKDVEQQASDEFQSKVLGPQAGKK